MARKYRLEGDATTTRWYSSKSDALEAYERAAGRHHLPSVWHAPGDVSGDAWEADRLACHGTRDGHGTVTLRLRESSVSRAAQSLGRRGGAARAARMTPEARSAASSATAKARWAKTRAFTLYSGFHNQRVTVRGAAGTHANGSPAWTLTERQARRVEDALCGVRDCCCLSTRAGRIVVECEPACEYTRYEPGAGACIDLRDVPPEV